MNAWQSSTHFEDNCAENPCDANHAIDRNSWTGSVTTSSDSPSWTVELSKPAKIDRIDLIVNEWAINQKYYENIMVETALDDHWNWRRNCIGVNSPRTLNSVESSIRCTEGKPLARYVKLIAFGGDSENEKQIPLYLNEVKIYGTG